MINCLKVSVWEKKKTKLQDLTTGVKKFVELVLLVHLNC